MTTPAIADIDRCIATIESSTKRWSGNADYRRFLETELFCLREVKTRLTANDWRDTAAVEVDRQLVQDVELSRSGQFECAGRKQALPEPGDCDWPGCGCDPHATKVIESLLEQGWSGPRG